ncbi:MAG: hypothetical protein ACFBRM_02050 [Pikeienuella sp.]
MEPSQTQAHVVVSDELRRLFLASRRGREATAAALPEPSRERAAPPLDLARLIRPWARGWRLRRDGRRPLTFSGLCLARRSIETRLRGWAKPLRQELALYADTTTRLYLTITLSVPEGLPLRPLHRVVHLTGAQSIAEVVADHEPSTAWAWLAAESAPASEMLQSAAGQLERDLHKLAEALVRAAPIAPSPLDLGGTP